MPCWKRKIANYLRRVQGAHGGWPLVHDGAFDMSASVKAYFALKMIGDSVDAPHMVRAREAIRSRGGAIHSNVFTRFMLAMFGVTDLAQRAGAAGRDHAAADVVAVPSQQDFLLGAHHDRAADGAGGAEAAREKRQRHRHRRIVPAADPHSIGMTAKAPHQSWGWFMLFRGLDSVLRVIEPLFPKKLRARAIDSAVAFIEERLNGEDGLGAIYPPMANAVMMYEVLGKPADYPPRAVTRRGLDRLLVIGEHEAYCQPCVSPVWDTALTCHALLEAGGEARCAPAKQGLDWLMPRQVLDIKGDWAVKRPDVRPGGWAFQYNNAYYPDLDDTAVVVMAMDRARRADQSHEYDDAIARGREWIEGMQSRDGGWAAFDVDNLEYYLNNIPFSDHGALLDPPTEDVTARCVSMLAQLGETVAKQQGGGRRGRLSAPDPACGGVMVRPLGAELHLRHLVGAVRAQCRRRRPSGPDDAQGRGLAGRRSRTRTAAGARMPSATGSTTRDSRAPHHRLANGMGLAWPDGGGRGRASGGRAWRGVPNKHTDRKRACGTSSATRQQAFRGYFICVIMATRSSFRSGRWRGIGI